MSWWRDSIRTSIRITAPAASVWAILVDAPAYATWNPFILSITVTAPPSVTSVQNGARLSNVLRTNNMTADEASPPQTMTFTPTVVEWEEGRSFAWLGRLSFGGLFDGRHRFTVLPAADGSPQCDLQHEEDLNGLIIWMGQATGGGWYKDLIANTTAGFHAMNSALKRRAEEQQQQPQQL